MWGRIWYENSKVLAGWGELFLVHALRLVTQEELKNQNSPSCPLTIYDMLCSRQHAHIGAIGPVHVSDPPTATFTATTAA